MGQATCNTRHNTRPQSLRAHLNDSNYISSIIDAWTRHDVPEARDEGQKSYCVNLQFINHLCSNASSPRPSASSAHRPFSSCTNRLNLTATAATDAPERLRKTFLLLLLAAALEFPAAEVTRTKRGSATLVSSVINRSRVPLHMGNRCACSASDMSSIVLPVGV
jgi:hypothetical protein